MAEIDNFENKVETLGNSSPSSNGGGEPKNIITKMVIKDMAENLIPIVESILENHEGEILVMTLMLQET